MCGWGGGVGLLFFCWQEVRPRDIPGTCRMWIFASVCTYFPTIRRTSADIRSCITPSPVCASRVLASLSGKREGELSGAQGGRRGGGGEGFFPGPFPLSIVIRLITLPPPHPPPECSCPSSALTVHFYILPFSIAPACSRHGARNTQDDKYGSRTAVGQRGGGGGSARGEQPRRAGVLWRGAGGEGRGGAQQQRREDAAEEKRHARPGRQS